MLAAYFGRYRRDTDVDCNYSAGFAKEYCEKNGYYLVDEYKDDDGKREKSVAF